MTNRSEPGVVQLNPRTWWRLAGVAEKRGVSLPELVELAVEELLKPKPKPPVVVVEAKVSRAVQLEQERRARREVLATEAIRLRDKDLTIAAIADLLGYSPAHISKILCDRGIRHHKRKDAA